MRRAYPGEEVERCSRQREQHVRTDRRAHRAFQGLRAGSGYWQKRSWETEKASLCHEEEVKVHPEDSSEAVEGFRGVRDTQMFSL